MYENLWQVRFSECDKNSRLTYKGIVDFFQDCSNLQSEGSNAGLSSLRESHKAWILDFWQIVIERRPKTFEDIKVATWPNGFRGFFGTRNFVMKSNQDEVLAYANSCWVFLDTDTGRPIKVTDDELSKYQVEEPYPMEYLDRKVAVPKELEYVAEILVQEHHLDVYNHMNNANYIEMACDQLAEGCELRQICCQYKKQARLGDIVKVYRAVEETGMTVVLKDAEDSIYAVIKLDYK